jgi:CRISPR/Cas system endoribonuclease Cas6 (RAMP superfamily)
VNWCPIIIKGKPETKLFAWNVGLGNSTGIGFGAIK